MPRGVSRVVSRGTAATPNTLRSQNISKGRVTGKGKQAQDAWYVAVYVVVEVASAEYEPIHGVVVGPTFPRL